MNLTRSAVLVLKTCLVVALAGAANACVLVPMEDAKAGHDVVVCHKGKTMTLPAEALQGHLNHGDRRGSC